VANHLLQIDVIWPARRRNSRLAERAYGSHGPGHDPAVNRKHTRFWYLFFAPQQLSKKKGKFVTNALPAPVWPVSFCYLGKQTAEIDQRMRPIEWHKALWNGFVVEFREGSWQVLRLQLRLCIMLSFFYESSGRHNCCAVAAIVMKNIWRQEYFRKDADPLTSLSLI
jgi:hypothetical protein